MREINTAYYAKIVTTYTFIIATSELKVCTLKTEMTPSTE